MANGRVNMSMVRICWNLCRMRLLCASLLTLLVSAGWIIAILQFLNVMMVTASSMWELKLELNEHLIDGDGDDGARNRTTVAGFNTTDDLALRRAVSEQTNVHYTVAYVAVMLVLVAMRTVAKAIALRTAIMMRNACAGAVFQATVGSSVQNRIASHQVRDCGVHVIGMLTTVCIFVNRL